ncbi:cold shock protein (beta-ribbon, CspA family) [Pseudonocardia oroxyli]|uniref:Cold shock protein (Beta-ribbon, CspA family) n=2 Tax=Pseudonocardia oroxyli TaxID=366584 RepID=A0A1G7RKB2_PSEOR|nr:cold shock protein (beta-ribbon, CspA family) [Pseudonocardia oroxyli]
MMSTMSTPGQVRVWHDEEGWGVIDSPSTPGGCWAYYSNIAIPDQYRNLDAGQLVELEWESAQQDGFDFRAVRVWPRGEEPYDRPPTPVSEGDTAYRSTLTIYFDDPPG